MCRQICLVSGKSKDCEPSVFFFVYDTIGLLLCSFCLYNICINLCIVHVYMVRYVFWFGLVAVSVGTAAVLLFGFQIASHEGNRV